MRIHRKSAIRLSGISWLAIGLLLFYRGVDYLFQASFSPGKNYLFPSIDTFFPSPLWRLTAIALLAMLIGTTKGCMIFTKTVYRVVLRINSFPNPIPIKKIYAPSYCFLIVSMMGVGLCFRFLPLPLDLKGGLDVAIGTALIIGSIFYFRQATRSSCSQ